MRAAQKEHLGYVSGGYRTVFARLLDLIGQGPRASCGPASKCRRCAHTPAKGIEIVAGRRDGGLRQGHLHRTRERAAQRRRSANSRRFRRRATSNTWASSAWRSSRASQLVPYYILNIADDRIPFTGVIGMSSLVATDETSGLYLTYLPKYVLSDDPMLKRTDDGHQGGVHAGLPEHVSRFRRSRHRRAFTSTGHSRSSRCRCSTIPRACRRRGPGTRISTSSTRAQFVSNTLNNNEVIRTVNAFLQTVRPGVRARMTNPTGACATLLCA